MGDVDRSLYISVENIFKYIVSKMKKELELLPGGEMTVAEVHTLMAIGNGDPKSMKEIVEELDVASSTPTRIVDRLVKKQLLTRFVDDEDRRKNFVQLTDTGRETYHYLIQQKNKYAAEALYGLTEEEKEFLAKILEKVNRNIK
ncbi:MAG: MarR family winged helix-turn-helix transcriptional regulator [Bacillota bacterium]